MDKKRELLKSYILYIQELKKLILSKGGQKQDALDTFQDALIVLYRKLETSDFKLTASFYTYLYLCHDLFGEISRRAKAKSKKQNPFSMVFSKKQTLSMD